MSLYILSALILVLFIVCFCVRSNWERRQLTIEQYTVKRNGKKTGKGSKKSGRLRIAFISDVHNYFDDPAAIKDTADAIKKSAPDLILFGGDMITQKKSSAVSPDTAAMLKFTEQLAEDYTIIYSMGNHESRFKDRFQNEWIEYRAKLQNMGVTVLDDSHVNAAGAAVYGVNLKTLFYKRLTPFIGKKKTMKEKYLTGKIGLPERDRFNILLMHSPMYLQEAEKWGADLVLSGHFHGGTIRLPDGRGLMTPQYQFFNKECSGVHCCRNTVMIVNRGLGTHTYDIRINNLPEISIIDVV